MPKESIEWDTALEYALPHKLTEDEKQVIRNNVNLAITTAVEARERVDENTSDGYHTFNEWAKQGKYNVHKSLKHSDGEDCFGGGWFIVTATLPSGQISNHYELKDWKLFRVDEHVKADEWDGHIAQDVVNRLISIINPSKK